MLLIPRFTFSFIFFPYTNIGVYSLEWSVLGVLGSFPWSPVIISISFSFMLLIISSNFESKYSSALAYPSILFLWPYSMSVSTRFVNIKPLVSLFISSIVFSIPSAFPFVCIALSIPLPLNKSCIFPIATTFVPFSCITSNIVLPKVLDSKSFLL